LLQPFFFAKKPTLRNAKANQRSREKQIMEESKAGSSETETEARIPSTKAITKEELTFVLVFAVMPVLLSAPQKFCLQAAGRVCAPPLFDYLYL